MTVPDSDSDQRHDETEDEQLAERLGAVLDEMAQQREAGLEVDIDRYLAEYPELRELLPEILATMEELRTNVSDLADESSRETEGVVGVGVQLGDFRLERQLGHGGMGVVYQATQVSLGRRVAVKVLPFASTLERSKLQRFKNEALAVASLEHPHIVPVISVGVDRGTHYFAMKHIRGGTLADYLRHYHQSEAVKPGGRADISTTVRLVSDSTRPGGAVRESEESEQRDGPQEVAMDDRQLPPIPSDAKAYERQVVAWVRDIAEALDYAHEMGIVHRDVKPANILLDEQGNVWMADFGLAANSMDSSLTMTGDLVGTIPYMSPEQAAGGTYGVDRRTDVYSLGVTLYEAIVGQQPFVRASQAEMVRAIAEQTPSFPQATRRQFSSDLIKVIQKAMAKAPEERYASALAISQDLGRLLRGEPVLAQLPSWSHRTRRWIARNRAVTVTTLIVVSSLIFTTVFSAMAVVKTQRSLKLVQRNLLVADTRMADEAIRVRNFPQAWRLLSKYITDGKWRDDAGFATRYLWKFCQPKALRFVEHRGDVNTVDWSSDGKQIVTADNQGKIILWNPDTLAVRHIIDTGRTSIDQTRFTPSNKFVLASSQEGDLFCYGADSGRLVWHVPKAHSAFPGCLEVSCNGEMLATGDDSGMVRVWRVATGEMVIECQSGFEGIHDVAFYDKDDKIVSLSSDRNARCFSLEKKQLVKQYTSKIILRDVAVDQETGSACCAGGSGEVLRLNLYTGKFSTSKVYARETRFYDIRRSAGGDRLVVPGKDGLTRVVKLTSSTPEVILHGHEERVFEADFSPDRRRVVTASKDGTCLVHDLPEYEAKFEATFPAYFRFNAEFSRDGEHLVYFNGVNEWKFRETHTGRETVLQGTHVVVGGGDIAFAEDGEWFATCPGPFLPRSGMKGVAGWDKPSPTEVDIDLDGDLDLLAAIGPQQTLVMQERLSRGLWAPPRLLNSESQINVNSLCNYIRPGVWRFTEGEGSDGQIHSYVVSAEQTQHFAYKVPGKDLEYVDVALFEDLDGDGIQELLVHVPEAKEHQLLSVTAEQPVELARLKLPRYPCRYTVADLDDDGLKDILYADRQEGNICWARQTSHLTFDSPRVIAGSLSNVVFVATVDLNGDKRLDVVSSQGIEIVWMENFGGGEFGDLQPYGGALETLGDFVPVIPDVAVWSTNSDEPVTTLFGLNTDLYTVAISPDHSLLATGGVGNEVRLFTLPDAEYVDRIAPGHASVDDLAFSPDGQLLAITCNDDCLLWDVPSRKLVGTLKGHSDGIGKVMFSRSGEKLFTCSNDNSVAVWDVAQRQRVHSLLGFRDAPVTLSESPDEKTLAVGTRYGDVVLWDLVTGQDVCKMIRLFDSLGAVAFRGMDELRAAAIDGGRDRGILRLFEAAPASDVPR
jgi:serine/threonine protein kinase/WD40 repeat protein